VTRSGDGSADLVFLTGPGGAGTTTLAAATAVRAARGGQRVLLLGVADAGELDAVLGERGERSTKPGILTVKRFDAAQASETALGGLSALLSGPLAAAGFSTPDAAEIGPVPGLPDILALRMIATEVSSGVWDTVVVDGPPLRAALDMLAWPETAAAALRRLRPIEGQAARSLRPLLAGLVGLPSPLTAVTRWTDEAAAEIAAVRSVFTRPGSVVRVVGSAALTAQPLQKVARTVLALQGLHHDAGTLAVSAVPRRPEEPIGLAALEQLAEAVYGGAEPSAEPAAPPRPRVLPDGEGYRYDLPLPGVEREALGLVRSGDELVVTIDTAGVAGHRRAFVLPAALRRCRIASARLDDGFLRVGFKPDESLWPERFLSENGAREQDGSDGSAPSDAPQ
jgi:arsenite-transporting ATPase